ncbi:hypothetical protein BDB00DRAFT_789085 [Zychaea mexicana]|uniref:uncharacterized protein n=1 Tax=Zychaea mexicana TaxID=64656 RepID=UPI0022FE0682|nr:uncharacterized protein BDB00DRAFT_789085 [Zychaea mexicana]KAI9491935.1 hypothetical protein BDB00DRAFT_789085 [Zychaea mexicana]
MTQDKCLVDVHTHVYLPEYLELLRRREQVPRVLPPLEEGLDERLIILPDEDKGESTKNGRPVGAAYYDVREKLAFMDKHDIDISVVSLANPWIDFLPPTQETFDLARRLNISMENMCQEPITQGRLYGMGTLPLSSVKGSVAEVEHIASLPRMRGVIMGTFGCGGKGLDDPALVPLFEAIAKHNLTIFLHPHYGVNLPASGNTDAGHSLALALGFPFETTYAVSRLILSGIFDRVPDLKILLAHSGGTLPFLAGRLDSCVAHDPAVASKLEHPPSHYLKKLYFDAVIYHATGVKATADFVDPSQIMFGTDHPFFPPLESKDARWMSVDSNLAAISNAGLDEPAVAGILGKNALRIFNLEMPCENE